MFQTGIKKIIFLLANLLVLITPFVFTGVNEELFEFNKILLVYSLTILIVFLWIMRMVFAKTIIFQATKLDLAWLAFLITQGLATLFSIHPYTSFFGYYTRFHGGLLSTICSALLYWALVSNLNHRQIKMLLINALIAGLGVSLYALPEKMGISPSCIILRQQFNTTCWIQDVRLRVFATFGQPNWLAAYLAMLLPLSLAGYFVPFKIKTLSKRLNLLIMKHQATLWLIVSLLMMLALIFTGSRSGWLALMVGVILASLIGLINYFEINYSSLINKIKLLFKKQPTFSYISQEQHSFFIKAVRWLMIATSLIVVFGSPFTPPISQWQFKLFPQVNTPVQELESPQPTLENPGILITPSEEIRRVVWLGAWRVWQRFPWLGSGPETFAYSYYLDRPMAHNHLSEWDHLYNKAHNELLNYLATSGIIGIVAYLYLVAVCFYLAWPKLKTEPDQPIFQLAILASLLAFQLSNFFGFSTVMINLLWVIMAAYLGASASQSLDRSVPAQALKKTRRHQLKPGNKLILPLRRISLWQILTIASSLLITTHLLLTIVSVWQADYLFVKGKQQIEAADYQLGVQNLQKSILLSPKQALFYDELANAYSEIALVFLASNDRSAAQEFAELAIKTSDQVQILNPHHLNFYQSRATLFSRLARLDPYYLVEAKSTLAHAIQLAPTHPKLKYLLGRIEYLQGNDAQAEQAWQEAIEMKPNYHEARYQLGQFYEEKANCPEAKKQYQYILEFIIPNDTNLKQKLSQLDC